MVVITDAKKQKTPQIFLIRGNLFENSVYKLNRDFIERSKY